MKGSASTRLGRPVHGGFRDGDGSFFGRDEQEGRPAEVRFIWSRITQSGARWEQAFTADGGASWETDWVMEFTRTG